MLKAILLALFNLLSFLIVAPAAKVVGYLPYHRFDLTNHIDFSKLTHLNLAFLNPEIDGNLS